MIELVPLQTKFADWRHGGEGIVGYDQMPKGTIFTFVDDGPDEGHYVYDPEMVLDGSHWEHTGLNTREGDLWIPWREVKR